MQTEARALPDGPGTASGSATGATRLPRWQERFDFDGDGRPDRIDVDFTGGAHCCYRISVTRGAGVRTELPFDLDGGYIDGLDLSKPDRFDVVVGSDRRAALRMEIATYNGEPQPIPPALTKELGVRSHRVSVSFDASGPRIANVGWRCDEALIVVKHHTWTAWEGLPRDCTLDVIADALLGTKMSDSPTQIGAAQSPATLVRLGLATPDGAHLDVTVAAGRVVGLAPTTDSDLDPMALVRAFGEPAAEASSPDSREPSDWIWPSRGLALRNRGSRFVGLTLFPVTDLEGYRQDVAPRYPPR